MLWEKRNVMKIFLFWPVSPRPLCAAQEKECCLPNHLKFQNSASGISEVTSVLRQKTELTLWPYSFRMLLPERTSQIRTERSMLPVMSLLSSNWRHKTESRWPWEKEKVRLQRLFHVQEEQAAYHQEKARTIMCAREAKVFVIVTQELKSFNNTACTLN